MYPHYDEEQFEMAEAVDRGLQQLGDCDTETAWKRMAEVGLPLLAIPTDDGGLATGSRTFHAVAEALGRHLVPSPLATSALVATRLVERLAAEPLRQTLLESLSTGETVLGLAWGEPHAHFEISDVNTLAEPSTAGWRVSGRKVLSVQSTQVTRWIVSAKASNGEMLLLLVDEGMPDLTVKRYECIDGSQACDLYLSDVEIERSLQLGQPGESTPSAMAWAIDLAELALCAESVGIQARLLQDTVQYSRDRRQFGATIGSFQVIQHRLVEMLVALEQARTLAWLLATEFDTADPERRSYLASAAKVRCILSGRFIGLQSIHLHGGMGVTDELPVGRGVKRLLAIENSFGNERFHLARLSQASKTQRSSASQA